jgi:hypothetical protein
MLGYEAMRFDFLHVRWFQLEGGPDPCLGWTTSRLDRLSFPPVAAQDAFGFVDPSLVLRSCHLIPAFSRGKRHDDGVGLSSMAKDGKDWKSYYVNRCDRFRSMRNGLIRSKTFRFADRDMTMRYHWGLGIGHNYSSDSNHLFQESSLPQIVKAGEVERETGQRIEGHQEFEQHNREMVDQRGENGQGNDLEFGFIAHDGLDIEFDDGSPHPSDDEDGTYEDCEDDIFDTYNPH